jgi:hypothetical protein
MSAPEVSTLRNFTQRSTVVLELSISNVVCKESSSANGVHKFNCLVNIPCSRTVSSADKFHVPLMCARTKIMHYSNSPSGIVRLVSLEQPIPSV